MNIDHESLNLIINANKVQVIIRLSKHSTCFDYYILHGPDVFIIL